MPPSLFLCPLSSLRLPTSHFVQPPQPQAGPLLSRFLEGKDFLCEGCNYNLRGVKTLFCPECGKVIPRPPHDQVAILEQRHHDLLWCPKCRYELHNIPPGDSCPECGYKFRQEDRPKPKSRGRIIPGVPGPLVFLGALAAIEMVPTFSKALNSTNRLTPTVTIITLGALLIPLALIAMFWLGRRRLNEMTTRGYWMLSTLAIALSLTCVIEAARLL